MVDFIQNTGICLSYDQASHYSYFKEILRCYTTQGRSITDPHGRYTHRETFASLTVTLIEIIAIKKTMQFSNGTNARGPKISCKTVRIEIASKIVQLYIL